ncbi:hypothetical protein AmDm5_0131 [Acetobacter malorum]|nr:hypothetical protein AmDm5_0131 [Acetobacter malorum]
MWKRPSLQTAFFIARSVSEVCDRLPDLCWQISLVEAGSRVAQRGHVFFHCVSL